MNSKFPIAVAAAISSLTLAGSAWSFSHLNATPDGGEEVPPNASPATGVGQFLIDTDSNTLFYHIDYSGLMGAETAAHIHGFAAPGSNAGVLHALPAGNPKIGAWVYTQAQEANILDGLTYVNIHSTMFPGGEIRGQVIVEPATDLVAWIDGDQENPPTGSLGTGIGVFDLDTAANTLSYDIRFGNLTGTESVAHIHGFAPPGTNAGVKHGLPLGSPKIGTWNYVEADEAGIQGELTYVNIHSTVNAGGEIRGQIINVSSEAVGVDVIGTPDSAMSLLAAPNPIREGTMALFYRAPGSTEVTVTIHNVSGRAIRTLSAPSSTGSGILAWDTRDNAGQPVAAGVYFARMQTASNEIVAKQLVVIR